MDKKIAGLQKQISALRGQRRELVDYLKEHGTLADKARLIQKKIWKCPTFDEYGMLLDPRWEGTNYKVSGAVFKKEDGPSVFENLTAADRDDPESLKLAIKFWGEEFITEAKKYSFTGEWDED